ncbi:MAG: hypothetical protein JWL68_5439 [Actinomycetia bacterium]|nr:hypothetical protein [Actinomycetes bacterium]
MTSRPQYPMDSGVSVFGSQDGGPVLEQVGEGAAAAGAEARPPAPPPADRGEVRWAMLAYLAVPFTLFLVPLAIYLTSRGHRRFARAHAAVALSLSLATVLYTVSIVIVGGVLALDSAAVGTLAAVPLLVLLWAGVLVVVIRAAAAASRGEQYQLPRWLRMTSGPPR